MLNTGVPSRSKSFREKARERFGLSRNKSRSVDVQRPSTLSSLRSKIQTVSATFKDSVSARDEECSEVQVRKGRATRIKVPTTSYTVRPSDTVFSIAAQFNVTPAEVKTLNRLSHSSELFPDQVIRVPDLDALAELERERKEREEEEERERKEQAANSLATSPRAGPGMATRVTPASPSSQASASFEEAPALSTEESVRERQFVKSEHARLITDGEGCVSGTLIITPQTLMFDPSVHDRLVQERGQAYFQWQIELRQVRTVAVYSDPRAMRLMVGDSTRLDNPDLSEAEMRMELDEEDRRFVETSSRTLREVDEERAAEDAAVKEAEAEAEAEANRGDEARTPAANGQACEPSTALEADDVKQRSSAEAEAEAAEEGKGVKEESDTAVDTDKAPVEKVGAEAEEKPQVEEIEEKKAQEAEKETTEVEVKEEEAAGERKDEEKKEESQGNDEESQEEEKVDMKEDERDGVSQSTEAEVPGGVSILMMDDDTWKAYCRTFDLRQRSASGSRLDYLCILYKPLAPGRRSFPFLSASPKPDQPRLPDRGQHWFTLPHEKNKELLAFLKDSHPEELDPSGAVPISPSSGAVTAMASASAVGAAAVGSAAVGAESFFVLQENHFADTPPNEEADDPRAHRLRAIRQQSLDWELINRAEVYGATHGGEAGLSIDEELLIPEIVGEARVLQEWMLKDIVRNLPSRAEGCLTVELAYSTHKHGFSLNSLYRKCRRETEDKPCMLLIRSQRCPPDSCFGAVLSCHLRVSGAFYGTGETYLMRWRPHFEKFVWSGNNNYIIKGSNKSIMIGSSSGAAALFIDEGLYRGRSQVCDTFEMPCPLTPDDQEDFVIENLEVWDFK